MRGVTHRGVASLAEISLGSTSYHFKNIDDLILSAFKYFAEKERGNYDSLFDDANGGEDIVEIAMVIVSTQRADVRNSTLLYELYAQAIRDDRYREIVAQWSKDATYRLEQLFGPAIARKFEVVWEGLTFQGLLTNATLTEDQTRAFFRSLLTD